MSEDKVFVTLIDDQGEELDFELVVSVEVNGNKYSVLISEEDEEEDLDEPEALIVRVGYDEIGEEIYEKIIDEDEFEKVKEALGEILVDKDELN